MKLLNLSFYLMKEIKHQDKTQKLRASLKLRKS
jgi:hypothetical protein